jgi:S-(hydroxymethyl)glutathione dehydrogenase/alcohol dehydrogenase
MFRINAAVLFELNKPLEIRILKLRPLESGQELVKILYSGVCRSQLMEVNGLRGDDRWLPHLLGHEGSGVVVDIGPDVKKFKKGDGVILSWIKGSGIEAQGALYDSDDLVINSDKFRAYKRLLS